MKTHEILFIVSIFLIILSAAFYMLSTTLISGTEEDSVSNILGVSTELDSTISFDDSAIQFVEMERERNLVILWIGISAGIFVFLAALVIKRTKEGPYLFVDREDDEFFI